MIRNLVTRGYGNQTYRGDIGLVVTRGYGVTTGSGASRLKSVFLEQNELELKALQALIAKEDEEIAILIPALWEFL